MQISGHHFGSSFFSAYKLAAKPQNQASSDPAANFTPSTAEIETASAGGNFGSARHDTLLLQSAHRTATRMADLFEALPEL